MKKTVKVLICIALCIIVLLSMGACGRFTIQDTQIRVHSISYAESASSARNGVSSWYYFEYTIEQVGAEEYENATTKIPQGRYFTSGSINKDGTVDDSQYDLIGSTPEDLKKHVGQSYYYSSQSDYYGEEYNKITYTALHIAYVYVTFFSDGSLEFSYYDNSLGITMTKRIKTDYYTVNYFSE